MPCYTDASIRKRLQATGFERGRSSVQDYMTAEHWPANQVVFWLTLRFVFNVFHISVTLVGDKSAIDGAEQEAPSEVVQSDAECVTGRQPLDVQLRDRHALDTPWHPSQTQTQTPTRAKRTALSSKGLGAHFHCE